MTREELIGGLSLPSRPSIAAVRLHLKPTARAPRRGKPRLRRYLNGGPISESRDSVHRYTMTIATALARFSATKPWRRMDVRLPLIAAAFILLSAIGTGQFAIYWQSQETAQRTAVLGAVYLDNLSANVVPSALANDVDGISLALERTLSYYEGIRDQSLFLFDNQKHLVAKARRDESPDIGNIPSLVFTQPAGTVETADNETAWVWRPLVNDGKKIGTLVAALDVAPINAGRLTLTLYVMLASILISVAVALVGMLLIRRQLNSIGAVSKHLELVAQGQFVEIPQSSNASETFATLRNAFNEMVVATREREDMAVRLAEQNRAAVLGRLAATIVHEVKNPLGGMQTALETIKKYGDNEPVRAEAVGLITRGLETVAQVIDATLETYKLPTKRRALSIEDLADVNTLIQAEAKQRGVHYGTDLQLPPDISVPAVETRQVLLNLLLNACRATPRDGMVTLSARLDEKEVRFEVADSGPGLEPTLLAEVLAGTRSAEGHGLGIPIVMRLIEEMRGHFEVENTAPAGTRWLITLPLAQGASL